MTAAIDAKPYFESDGIAVYHGDCRSIPLPDASVQTCVTSPPYWGLRDYGVDGQLGHEPTPELYVANMVDVFREVRRVLKDDGTVWLNLGDSYAGSWGNYSGQNRGRGVQREITTGSQISQEAYEGQEDQRPPTSNKVPGLKNKDLVGIPWRVAFALQADGWYLRQDIIWAKPNPMPESVEDRCTKSHEYLFLLSKSERYFYDKEAIAEPVSLGTIIRLSQPNLENQQGSDRVPGRSNGRMKAVGHLPGNKSHRGAEAYEAGEARFRTKVGLVGYSDKVAADPSLAAVRNKRSAWMVELEDQFLQWVATQPEGQALIERFLADATNKTSVWPITTQPFKGAHFAVFPPALVEPCIKAGSRPGDIVLDPFNGSGTTGEVSHKWGRRYVGMELNASYIDLTAKRFTQPGLFPLTAAREAANA